MSRSHFVAFACILTLLASARGAEAVEYNCPAANSITCVPVQKTIGAWKDNGSMSTGTRSDRTAAVRTWWTCQMG